MIKTILAIAKQTAKEDMYYRFDMLLYIFNFIVEICVYIFIWLAIYNSGGQVADMNFKQITTYYILVVSINPIIMWGINDTIGNAIREGQILRELLNPISYFNYNFGIRLGCIIESGLVGIITFAICSILFGVLLPSSIINFIAFVVLIFLSVVSVYFIELIFGSLAFYTNTIWGVEVLKRGIINIFSGMIAPIALFPELIQKIANILPFKEYVYTPIQIYFGELSNYQIAQVIFKQVIWIIILYIIAKVIFKNAIKKITINGG